MTSASALKRDCGYPRVLSLAEPRTAKERDQRKRRDEAAARGTVFHDAIKAWSVAGTVIPEVADDEARGWIEVLAMTWAPRPDMYFETPVGLTAQGVGWWCVETSPHVYAVPSLLSVPLITAGRPDVLWTEMREGRHILVLRDWKTGKWPVDPPARNLQTTALAIAACSLAEAEGFVREIYYVRDGHLDADETPVMVGSPEYTQALADVVTAAALDDTPRPGPHCAGCWESRMKRCAHAA